MLRSSIFKIIILFTIYLIVHNSLFAQYQIQRSVFGNGCGTMKSANHASVNTLGQPLIGFCNNPSYYIYLGFWYTVDILVAIPEVTDLLPKQFELFQNYPNPFNPVTHIDYALPKPSQVRIEVYNLLGQRISTLVNDHKPPGYYTVKFDASNLAGGYYLYRLQTQGFNAIKKMILMR